MIPYHFDGQTDFLEAADGHDHKADGEIVGLPVKIERDMVYNCWTFTSVWKPTPDQLAVLNAGGAVATKCLYRQIPLSNDVIGADALKVPA